MQDKITGRYIKGTHQPHYVPIGTIRLRKRTSRPTEIRYFIKVSEDLSKGWIFYSKYLWENKFGKTPKGYQIHHKDHNKLNDVIENLELLTISQHSSQHKDFNYTEEELQKAAELYFKGGITFNILNEKTGIPIGTLSNRVQKLRKNI